MYDKNALFASLIACNHRCSGIALVEATKLAPGHEVPFGSESLHYAIGFFARSSATISAAACRALSALSGGKLIAPTRAWPPPP